MGLAAVSPVVQQRLAVGVPLVALAISLFIVYPAWGRYNDLKAQIVKQENELNTLKSNPVPPPGDKILAAPLGPEEPPQFLGLMTQLANSSGCRIAGYTVSQPSSSKEQQIVQAVPSTVELECRFPQLRSFLYQASRVPRLITVTNVSISANTATGQPNMPISPVAPLKATVGLERYVTAPESAQTP